MEAVEAGYKSIKCFRDIVASTKQANSGVIIAVTSAADRVVKAVSELCNQHGESVEADLDLALAKQVKRLALVQGGGDRRELWKSGRGIDDPLESDPVQSATEWLRENCRFEAVPKRILDAKQACKLL